MHARTNDRPEISNIEIIFEREKKTCGVFMYIFIYRNVGRNSSMAIVSTRYSRCTCMHTAAYGRNHSYVTE